MKVLLSNLRAYHPSKAHADIDNDQDSDIELEDIATYILMKDHSIITYIVTIGRKHNTKREFALVVDTREELCKKIRSMDRQHEIVINIMALTKDITIYKIEIKELKRKLAGHKKLTIVIQYGNMIIEDIKKKISLNSGIQ